MLNILRLLRVQNLLIVAVTMYFMRYFILYPLLDNFPIEINNRVYIYQLQLQLSALNFFFLVFATICITAAGYVINDYFDRKTDLLNRPETVIVGKHLDRRYAIILHVALNVIGVGLGFYVSIIIGIWKIGFLFLAITGLLFYYSTSYKRQFLTGNLIVAILVALVPLMVALFEIPMLIKTYREIMIKYNFNFYKLFFWVLGFSFFAFFTNLIREIIKDIEDFEGDNAFGRNTVPIVLGIHWSKAVIISLSAICIFSLIVIYIRYFTDKITLWYFIIMINLFLVQIFLALRARDKQDYHRVGFFAKLIMLIGIIYSPVVYYIINYN